MKISVVGLDPSLSNWGIVRAELDIDTLEVSVDSMSLVETKPSAVKTVRKNSGDLLRARQLYGGLMLATTGVAAAFCEVPVGSQSARAMASYGVCIGVLASCRVPLIELSPSEVKIAAVNHREAAKIEMIEWGVNKHPDAPWIRDREGKLLNKNEHLADALASIYAGVRTPAFESVLNILKQAHGK